MLTRVKPRWAISENEVTPENIFFGRRQILKGLGFLGVGLSIPQVSMAAENYVSKTLNSKYSTQDSDHHLTQENLIGSYNNFYEFSLDKGDVKPLAEKWKRPSPWKIEIGGLIEKPMALEFNELVKFVGAYEERIYRFRCVEAWSMVVPWGGFPLAELIKKLSLKKNAKYVKFVSYFDKKSLPGVSSLPLYPWPYTEGLTLQEAMNPLTMMATKIYGKDMANQNGAPLRLVVPWKYGFKSIKSIVKIEFVEKQPETLWNSLAPNEYGFYANVNPEVDHPRWSQGRERVLDGSFIPRKIKTLKFNGYESEVASLYQGLDLSKNF